MKYFTVFLLFLGVRAEEWDASNYPNPTTGGFQKCRMRSRANICDPDGVLTEAARYRLDNDLKQLEARTRQENGATFCEKKGITAVMAVARHVRGGSTDAVKLMAADILKKWTLDSQCQKSVVFVVSTDDMKFWVARDDMVPIFAEELTELFMQQKKQLQQGDYQTALTNILHGTWEKALSKQGAPVGPRPDLPASPGFGDGGGMPPKIPRERPTGGMKMPSIPAWIWLAIIFGLIPLLCCCLCCYFCCCKGKGGGAAASAPHNDPYQDGGGRAQGGGGRSGFSNLITSMGGAGIGSLIGNMISGRNRGSGGGGGMFGGGGGQGGYSDSGYGGGSGYNPAPTYDNQGRGGRGLYPATPHKDEGGGGSWG